MTVFLALITKIIPLYLVIGIGYLAEKKFEINKKHIADLLIYILGPAVVFLGTYRVDLRWEIFSLPIIVGVICSILSLAALPLAGKIWDDGTENIVAFSAGNGNTGYFGIPVCLALLGEQSLPLVVMFMLGTSLAQNTAGYYVIARHEYTAYKTLQKLLRLPLMHALFAGLLLNFLEVQLSPMILETLEILKAAYVPLGIMAIGFALVGVRWQDFDLKLAFMTLFIKFVIWPVLFFGFIYLDKAYFHLYGEIVHQVIAIQSLVPIAANTVVFAEELHDHPEKAAVIIIISTLIALVYIPLMIAFFF